MAQAIRWNEFPDADAVAAEAVQRILAAADAAIAARGVFRLVLAGGSTPLQVYRQLADCQADWSRWFLYLGDERCLPADDPERNSVMISEAWLHRGQVPAEQIFWMPAEKGAEQGAAAYRVTLQDVPGFDLVLLGMGEDGHTASLFPGHEHDTADPVVAVFDSPKPPPQRISLNYGALANTRTLLLLVAGASKHAAIQNWQNGAALPVAGLDCAAGFDVLVDAAALRG